tara:strand:- start:7508 stop:8449 length:942 start_codon:yes stop_codon:yes gene_type:complete
MTEITNSQKLQEPFPREDISWRVQSCGLKRNGEPWVKIVAYVTSRAIHQRFDDIFEFDGWQSELKESPDRRGVICGISIYREDGSKITKWDGLESKSQNKWIDETKSVNSGAFKRAAVLFGPGRYLYDLKETFAICHLVDSKWDAKDNHAESETKGVTSHINWTAPSLPEWALPHIKSDSFIENMKNCEDLASLKYAFNDAWRHTKAFGRLDLQPKFKSEYDAMVIKIGEIAKTNIETALKAAQYGMNKQLNTLHLIPDASAVSVICETLKKDMTNAHEGQYYDLKPLIQEINKQQAARIDAINNTEVKPNEQ